jgi:hypothetical protein
MQATSAMFVLNETDIRCRGFRWRAAVVPSRGSARKLAPERPGEGTPRPTSHTHPRTNDFLRGPLAEEAISMDTSSQPVAAADFHECTSEA